MQKLIHQFLLISTCLLFFISCKTYQVGGAVKKDLLIDKVGNKYFSNPQEDYIYKANIKAYGNEFGGIFVAKKVNDTTHRVVFTTDFGNKLIDLELSKNSFKVNRLIDKLDRGIIKKVLEKDFRLLLQSDYDVDEVYEDDNYIIYKSNTNKEANYLYFDKETNSLCKIVNASKIKEKLQISFDKKYTIFADSVTISHQDIRLKITLQKIN